MSSIRHELFSDSDKFVSELKNCVSFLGMWQSGYFTLTTSLSNIPHTKDSIILQIQLMSSCSYCLICGTTQIVSARTYVCGAVFVTANFAEKDIIYLNWGVYCLQTVNNTFWFTTERTMILYTLKTLWTIHTCDTHIRRNASRSRSSLQTIFMAGSYTT